MVHSNSSENNPILSFVHLQLSGLQKFTLFLHSIEGLVVLRDSCETTTDQFIGGLKKEGEC